MNDDGQQIQVSNAGSLAGFVPMMVGDLEQALLKRFPREDACDWDRMGLLVGDPGALITGVAVALDPTVDAMYEAAAAGANVLLTHHPVYLDPPANVLRYTAKGHDASGSIVYAAVSQGINCINFHTALDFSVEGLAVLPKMLRLKAVEPFEPLESDPFKGFGMLCEADEENLALDALASRCLAVFGRMPRVWGNPNAQIGSVVTAGGSAGDLLDGCVDRGIDCLICGEVKYHDALDACGSGLCIIELGHDVSELPFTGVLVQAALDAGVKEEDITVLNQNNNWHTPESIRR